MDVADGAGGERDQAAGGIAGKLSDAARTGVDGQVVDNLMTFPLRAHRCERGELALHGAYFDVATGELCVLDPAIDGRFAA